MFAYNIVVDAFYPALVEDNNECLHFCGVYSAVPRSHATETRVSVCVATATTIMAVWTSPETGRGNYNYRIKSRHGAFTLATNSS